MLFSWLYHCNTSKLGLTGLLNRKFFCTKEGGKNQNFNDEVLLSVQTKVKHKHQTVPTKFLNADGYFFSPLLSQSQFYLGPAMLDLQ